MSLSEQPATCEGTESTLSPPEVGTRVSLESTRLVGRMWSRLVGWRSGEYLLLETPEKHIPPGYSVAFSAEDSLTVRYMADGVIVGFRAPVLGRVSHPAALTAVAWPTQVYTHSLRREPRLACYLPCRVSSDGRLLGQAVVLDVSLHGCCVRIPVDPALEEDVLAEPASEAAAFSTGQSIELVVSLPEDDGVVAVSGRLVNIEETSAHHLLRITSEAPMQRLVDFVGMFVTRVNARSA